MKHTLALVLIVFGLVCCATYENNPSESNPKSNPSESDFNFYDEFYKKSPEQRYQELVELDSQKERYARQKGSRTKQLIYEKEKKIKELIARCEEFGFQGDNNIAACIQREIKVDLTLAKQEKKIDQLENRINSLAQSQESKKESSSSVLVDLLSIIAEEAERQNEMEDRVRLYKLESKVNAINSRNNAKQANCVLNRNC